MPSYRHWINPLLALIAICQVIYFLSRRFSTVPKLQNVSSYMPNMPHTPNLPAFLGGKKSPPSSAVAEIKHPIAKLMEDAESEFRRKVNGQSRTLSKAVEEYERRYKRPPPRGFDDWFKFAVDNEVRIIDEYDSMVKDLRPFENMSGEELRARALQVRFLVLFDSVSLTLDDFLFLSFSFFRWGCFLLSTSFEYRMENPKSLK
jgi:hypothetical protein